jgi:hypothetical protein
MSVNMACTTRADGCSLCSAIIYDTLIYPGNILRNVVSIPGSDCGGSSCSEDLARRARASETYDTLAPNTTALPVSPCTFARITQVGRFGNMVSFDN